MSDHKAEKERTAQHISAYDGDGTNHTIHYDKLKFQVSQFRLEASTTAVLNAM